MRRQLRLRHVLVVEADTLAGRNSGRGLGFRSVSLTWVKMLGYVRLSSREAIRFWMKVDCSIVSIFF